MALHQSVLQDNLVTPVLDCQSILDFAGPEDDGGSGGDKQNSITCT